jgi:hypothetical protein
MRCDGLHCASEGQDCGTPRAIRRRGERGAARGQRAGLRGKGELSECVKALRRAALEELALSVDTLLDHIHIKASQVDPVT